MSPTPLQAVGRVAAAAAVADRASEFCASVKCLAAAKGELGAAARYAQAAKLGRVIDRLEQRAAVVAGTTGDATWAAPLAEPALIAAFVASLRTVGAFDQIAPSTNQAPLQTRVLVTTSAPTGTVLRGGGSIKPISAMAFASVTLSVATANAIVVASEELMRSAAPEAFSLFSRELKSAVAYATDQEFLRIVTDGVSSFVSSGNSGAGLRQDIRTLLAAVSTGASSALFIITTSAIAKALSAISDTGAATSFPDAKWNGGSIFGIPIVVSDAATAGTITLLDASGVATGATELTIDTSTNASLQMDTAPDSPPLTTNVPLSMFQQNMIAVRCERTFGVEFLRTTAAAIITSVNPLGVSPA